MKKSFTRFCCLSSVILALTSGCGSETTPTAESSANESKAKKSPATTNRNTEKETKPSVDLHPVVSLKTNFGDIQIKLDRETAPITVDNFLDYVNRGHYDGTVFHQVVKGYILLGGGFTVALDEKSSRTPIRNEAHQSRKNVRGTIAMARQFDTIDSATCQFFINLNDNPSLDHKGRSADAYGYCVFGEIVDGWDAVDRIANVDVEDTNDFELKPVETVVIESARIVR